MRVLHCKGIFSYDSVTDEYRNNHVSDLLVSSHWTGWSNWVELYTVQFYEMAKGIPESIKKDANRGAAQYAFQTEEDMFTYFDKQVCQRDWVVERTLPNTDFDLGVATSATQNSRCWSSGTSPGNLNGLPMESDRE